jgi:hypothetical protein
LSTREIKGNAPFEFGFRGGAVQNEEFNIVVEHFTLVIAVFGAVGEDVDKSLPKVHTQGDLHRGYDKTHPCGH